MNRTMFGYINFKGIYSLLESFQKILNAYEKIQPVIVSSIPIINNFKTTIRVIGAFNKINKNNNLISAFDYLPDYNEIDVSNKINIIKESDIENPFYP